MLLLDCFDSASALGSLGHAIQVDPHQLAATIVGYDSSRLAIEPYQDIARSVLEALEADLSQAHFDGVCFFHGTRVPDPSVFQRLGILPLRSTLDEIWAFLGGLVDASVRERATFRKQLEIRGGGDFGEHYRRKVARTPEQGPFALLVRELHGEDRSGYTNYLRCPEIVTDIAESFDPSGELERKYIEATRPCVVKFRTRTTPTQSAIDTAFAYLYFALPKRPLPSMLAESFSGGGTAVEAIDVLGVEVLRGT